MRRGRVVLVAVCWLACISGPAAAESDADRRLRHLEEQLDRALREIHQLKGELEQQKAVGRATQKKTEETATAVQEEKTKVAAQKPLELPEWLKRVSLFGDVRMRHEGFYHQPSTKGTTVTARNREKLRARLGLRVAFSDELSTTVRMASGNPNDPTTTEEDWGNVFTRKNWNLDWAYITFSPAQTFNLRPGMLTLISGKQPVPFFRVGELIWDDDLSPEGFSQTVALLDRPRGFVDQVKLNMYQWQFAEVTNNQDGWIIGGQVNPTMHFGTTQVEVGLAHTWYLNPDLIAQAANTNSKLKITNLVLGSKPNLTGFESGFSLSNETVAGTIPNVGGARPPKLFQDYVYNWEAATDDAHGVMAGLKLGQTKTRGDWAVTTYYEYLGREAALGTFTNSDLNGTNTQGPVFGLEYQLLDPLTVSARTLTTTMPNRPEGVRNKTQTRVQLDAIVKF